MEEGTVEEYFISGITSTDEEILSRQRGGSEGQQTWEALASLVALRHWSPRWKGKRVTLRVRSDSITALTMVLKLKAKGAGTSIISREMALDIAEAVYSPSIASHLPGVANITADVLSRFDEGNPSLPPHLRGVPRAQLAVRDHRWWRSLRRPSAVPGG